MQPPLCNAGEGVCNGAAPTCRCEVSNYGCQGAAGAGVCTVSILETPALLKPFIACTCISAASCNNISFTKILHALGSMMRLFSGVTETLLPLGFSLEFLQVSINTSAPLQLLLPACNVEQGIFNGASPTCVCSGSSSAGSYVCEGTDGAGVCRVSLRGLDGVDAYNLYLVGALRSSAGTLF